MNESSLLPLLRLLSPFLIQIANLLGRLTPSTLNGSEANGDLSVTARLEYLSGAVCCIRRFRVPSEVENIDFSVGYRM